MTAIDCYSLLGLKQGASMAEIKKAYRIKALQYHPDKNESPDAAEMFVRITEAYQYLINDRHQAQVTEAEREKAYAAWVAYRSKQAKQEAESYAKSSFNEFRKSDLYKSSHSIDGNILVFGFILSILIICYSFYGYFYRVSHATTRQEMPSLALMLLSLAMGAVFLIITTLYFLAWREDKKKERNQRYK